MSVFVRRQPLSARGRISAVIAIASLFLATGYLLLEGCVSSALVNRHGFKGLSGLGGFRVLLRIHGRLWSLVVDGLRNWSPMFQGG